MLDLSKLEPLDGTNYKRWSQKLLICFEQVEVDYVLFNNPPVVSKTTSTQITILDTPAKESADKSTSSTKSAEEEAKKYDRDNKFVRGHILSHMTNPIFDLSIKMKSAKEIWETLEKKYGADDAGKKKYVTGN